MPILCQQGHRPLGSTSHKPSSVSCAGDPAHPRPWVLGWPGPPRAITREWLSAHISRDRNRPRTGIVTRVSLSLSLSESAALFGSGRFVY